MKQLLSHQEIAGIRDLPDAREAADVHFDRLGLLTRLLRKTAMSSTGARIAPKAGCPTGIATGVDGGIVQTHRGPECVRPGCADILGFNTLNVANFPFAGTAVGTVANTAAVVVGSGNAQAFQATQFFFEGRDNANALANVVCLLADVSVSGVDQLVDNANTSGITSAVFALTNEPLYVGWDAFTDTGNTKRLNITFANILAAAVTLEIFGVLWGTRDP